MEDPEFVDIIIGDKEAVAVPALVLDPERPVGAGDRLKIVLDDVLRTVMPVTDAVRKSVQRAAPDETTLTFKIGVAIAAGQAFAFIAEGKIDGAIEISLKWKN